MSANVETMMYAGEVPWHRLGTRVGDKEVTAEQAIVAAGLDWTVSTRPMFTAEGAQVPRAQVIVRDSDNSILGTSGSLYAPIQNRTAFSMMDSIVGEGAAVYHTAGALGAGHKVWILCKLAGEDIVVGNDRTEKFVLLTNSHDGQGSLRCFFTPIRVVCQNTLNVALGKAGTEGVSIRHFANADQRIKEAAEAMNRARAFYTEFETIAQRMGTYKWNDKAQAKLAAHLFPGKPDLEKDGKLHPFTVENRARVESLFRDGMGHGDIAGTAWAAWNAVTEYVDHERSPKLTAWKRADSMWFGSGASLKADAFTFIKDVMEQEPATVRRPTAARKSREPRAKTSQAQGAV